MDKLKFNAIIDPKSLQVLNSEFTKAKAYVMYYDDNRNNSSMSKESVERAIPSIYNTPVVGEFIEKVEDFGTHGGKIIISDNGVEYIQTTKPYGVVPESANPRWELVKHKDEEEKEYLVVDVILWSGRYEELEKTISEFSNQSMEINIIEGDINTDGIFQIEDFEFSALCILGQEVEPCFEEAKVMVYGLDEFKTEMTSFMENYKEFENQNHALPKEDIGTGEKVDMDNSADSAIGEAEGTWGNVDKANLRDKVMEPSNYISLANETYLLVDEDTLKESPSSSVHYPHHDFSGGKLVIHIDGLEATGSRLNQVKSEGKISDADYDKALKHINKHRKVLGLEDLEPFKEGEDEEDMKFELSMRQKLDALQDSISSDTVLNEEEDKVIEETHYWVRDFDSEFVYINRYHWTIDGESKDNEVRGKYQFNEDGTANIDKASFEVIHIVRMTEEEMNALEEKRNQEVMQLEAIIEDKTMTVDNFKVEVINLEKFRNELENDLEEKVVQFDSLTSDNEELKDYKEKYEQKLLEEKQSQVDDLISEFEKELQDVEEFNKIKENAMSMELNELNKELFALVGMKKHKFTKEKDKKQFSAVPIVDDSNNDDDTSEYGEMSKYINKPEEN